MNNLSIKNFKITPLDNPNFVQPVRLHYSQNDILKSWEAVKAHDSVSILLYHTQKEAFLLVKQFRAPVYMHHDEYKYTYELCAGIIDKDTSLLQIAKEEIDEECGFNVELENIEKITSFFTNVGVSGSKQYLYFTNIDDSIKIHNGGGINDEQIQTYYLPLKEAKEFIYDESKAKTPGLMFAFYWFFEKYKKDL